MNFDYINYRKLIFDFFKEYQTEFGKINFEKKIQTSKKVSELIFEAKLKQIVPNAINYIHGLNEIPYFIFSKADTIALGALMALERWNNECNKVIVFADEILLKEIACKILENCSKMKFKL